jgi:hypothetical protein
MTDALILTGNVDTAAFVHWPLDKKIGNLKEMQAAVGGSIELVGSASGVDIYCNEEGMLKDLPQNESAAYLLYELTKRVGIFYGPFVFLFRGQGKEKAKEKVEAWFAKYKAGKIGDEEDSDEQDEDADEQEDDDDGEELYFEDGSPEYTALLDVARQWCLAEKIGRISNSTEGEIVSARFESFVKANHGTLASKVDKDSTIYGAVLMQLNDDGELGDEGEDDNDDDEGEAEAGEENQEDDDDGDGEKEARQKTKRVKTE